MLYAKGKNNCTIDHFALTVILAIIHIKLVKQNLIAFQNTLTITFTPLKPALDSSNKKEKKNANL